MQHMSHISITHLNTRFYDKVWHDCYENGLSHSCCISMNSGFPTQQLLLLLFTALIASSRDFSPCTVDSVL